MKSMAILIQSRACMCWRSPPQSSSCGLDKKVKAWGRNLEVYGTLLQTRDRAFSFPYDPSDVREKQLEEAMQVLRRTEGRECAKPASHTQALPDQSKKPDEE